MGYKVNVMEFMWERTIRDLRHKLVLAQEENKSLRSQVHALEQKLSLLEEEKNSSTIQVKLVPGEHFSLDKG